MNSHRQAVASLYVAMLLALAHSGSSARAGSFLPAGTLNVARAQHSATLLPDGRVLVAGGISTNATYAPVEIFDPQTRTWTVNEESRQQRRGQGSPVLLHNGHVLFIGSGASELYDPVLNRWSDTTNGLRQSRNDYSVTVLTNGAVLVAGGYATGVLDDFAFTGIEYMDPFTGFWTNKAELPVARGEHTATLLPDGRVLVAGGRFGRSDNSFTTADFYDPASDIWTPTTPMNAARILHTATLLTNGRVLVVSGKDLNFEGRPLTAGSEVFDPLTTSWTETSPMIKPRYHHTATLLGSGRVLVAGGIGGPPQVAQLADAEIYDVDRNKWSATNPLRQRRYAHTATRLQDGSALMVGGYYQQTIAAPVQPIANAELYVEHFPVELSAARREDGSLHLSFTNAPSASFTVLSSTNIGTPYLNWKTEGTAAEPLAGQYQFVTTSSAQQKYFAVRVD